MNTLGLASVSPPAVRGGPMRCAMSRIGGEAKKLVPRTSTKKSAMNVTRSASSFFSGIPTTRRLLRLECDSKSSTLAFSCVLSDCRREHTSSRATIRSLWSDNADSTSASFSVWDCVVDLMTSNVAESGFSASSIVAFSVEVKLLVSSAINTEQSLSRSGGSLAQ